MSLLDIAAPGGGFLMFRVGDFVADPGQSYFTSIEVSCLFVAGTFTSASANHYFRSGIAQWIWPLPPNPWAYNSCIVGSLGNP